MVAGIWSCSHDVSPEEVELARPLLEAALREGKTTVDVGNRVWTFKRVLIVPG